MTKKKKTLPKIKKITKVENTKVVEPDIIASDSQ